MSNRLSNVVIPSHYALNITPAVSQRPEGGFETFQGGVAIQIEFQEESNKVVLNSKKLNIHSCSLVLSDDGKQLDGVARLDEQFHQLLIVFPETVPAHARATLSISYDGICGTDSTGLYQNSYQGGRRRGLATQLQSTDARKFFPCFDEPQFKATFELTVTVPSFYTVLFNTLPKDVVVVDSTRTRHSFHATPKMSTYLLALFVGEADAVEARSRSGVLVRVWTPVGERDVGTYALDWGVKVLDYFEDYYGIAFPLKKLDMIGLDSFLYGGMENWGLITYSSQMFYVTGKASFGQRKRCAYVVAHECAHMWFGNLVTMKWWNDLWLNEGFATYAGWQAVRAIEPKWDVDCILYTDELSRALVADSFVRTHAVEVDPSIDDADEIASLTDNITYSKGLACLVLAADVCGERAFQAGVRSYLKEFQYSNAVAKDLYRHLSTASGKDVGDIIGKWVSYVGHPIVTVQRESRYLIVKQRRFIASGEQVAAPHPWPVPIKLSWSTGKTEFLLTTNETSFQLPLSATDAPFLLVNAGHQAMYRVAYAKGMWHDLLSNIELLAAVDRLALLDGIAALAQANLASSADFLQLVVLLEKDTSPHVAATVLDKLGAFSAVWRRAKKSKLAPDLTLLTARVCQSYLSTFGEQPRPNENPVAGGVRDLALSRLAADKTSAYHQKCLALLPRWKEYLDSPELRNILTAAGTSDDPHRFAQLMSIAEELKGDASKHTTALSCAALTHDRARLASLIEMCGSGAMFSVWCSIEDRDFLWDYLREHWDALHHVSGGSANTFGRMTAHIFAPLSDAGLIGEMTEFYEKLPQNQLTAIAQYVDQSKERILRNHAWIERDYTVVETVLERDTAETPTEAQRAQTKGTTAAPGRSATPPAPPASAVTAIVPVDATTPPPLPQPAVEEAVKTPAEAVKKPAKEPHQDPAAGRASRLPPSVDNRPSTTVFWDVMFALGVGAVAVGAVASVIWLWKRSDKKGSDGGNGQ